MTAKYNKLYWDLEATMAHQYRKDFPDIKQFSTDIKGAPVQQFFRDLP